jgi:hypothetical protein
VPLDRVGHGHDVKIFLTVASGFWTSQENSILRGQQRLSWLKTYSFPQYLHSYAEIVP